VGLAEICIALSLQGVKSILDAWWALASVFSGGMLGLFLLGYVSDRTSSRHALVGVIAGVISIGWLSLSPLLLKGGPWSALANPFHPNLTIVFGTSVIFLTGFLLSYLAANRKSETRFNFSFFPCSFYRGAGQNRILVSALYTTRTWRLLLSAMLRRSLRPRKAL
jgi:SSS family solute:Na+ symporter